jgi:hypothetical protein
MLPSNYLKQADFDEDGSIVTISHLEYKNIAKEGQKAEMKWLCSFKECDKPLVLNSTNIQLLEKCCGSDDTDDWIGKQVIVYVEPNVSFGNELVGGLRIKRHRTAQPKPAAVRRAPSDSEGFANQRLPDDGDVPWKD